MIIDAYKLHLFGWYTFLAAERQQMPVPCMLIVAGFSASSFDHGAQLAACGQPLCPNLVVVRCSGGWNVVVGQIVAPRGFSCLHVLFKVQVICCLCMESS